MTDIVERLRELAETERPFARGYITEAANEIERLRLENRDLTDYIAVKDKTEERLRAALKEIADDPGGHPAEDALEEVRGLARKALEPS